MSDELKVIEDEQNEESKEYAQKVLDSFVPEMLDTPAETPVVEETAEEKALKAKMKNLAVMSTVKRGAPSPHNAEKSHGNIQTKKDAERREKKARKIAKASRKKNRR